MKIVFIISALTHSPCLLSYCNTVLLARLEPPKKLYAIKKSFEHSLLDCPTHKKKDRENIFKEEQQSTNREKMSKMYYYPINA